MATGQIMVYVVDVGQGQCTYVEILDTTGALVQSLLFDCGSNSRHKFDGIVNANLEYIAHRIGAMTTPKIDAVIFSHGDTDHTNLTKKLLLKINALLINSAKKLAVGQVWYGGNFVDYYKNSYNILTYIKDNFGGTLLAPPDDSTNLNEASGHFTENFTVGTTNYPQLWKSADDAVIVYLLVGNVVGDDPDSVSPPKKKQKTENAETKNRVSLVSLLRFAGKDYVIAGDATNRAMAWVNYYANASVLNNTNMVTTPHHGSRNTALENPLTNMNNDTATASTFAQLIKGKTVTVSAYKSHGHPSLTVLELFTPCALLQSVVKDPKLAGNSHYIVANIDRDLTKTDGTAVAKDFATFATESNVYTTYCYRLTPDFSIPTMAPTITSVPTPTATIPAGPPPPAFNTFASWIYSTTNTGITTLAGVTSLPTNGINPTANIFTTATASPLALNSDSPSLVTEHSAMKPTKTTEFIVAPSKPPAKTPRFEQKIRMRSFK